MYTGGYFSRTQCIYVVGACCIVLRLQSVDSIGCDYMMWKTLVLSDMVMIPASESINLAVHESLLFGE